MNYEYKVFLCWYNIVTKCFKYKQIEDAADLSLLAVKLQVANVFPYNIHDRSLIDQAQILAKCLNSKTVFAYAKEATIDEDPWDMVKGLRRDVWIHLDKTNPIFEEPEDDSSFEFLGE